MWRVVLLACLVPGIALAQPAVLTETPPAREGLTIEVNAGLGWIRTSPEVAASYTSGVSFALDGGAGWWLTPKLALTGRLAGLTNLEGGEVLGAYLVGPNVQYWPADVFFVAGGVGIGVLLSTTGSNDVGLGFDLRAGFAFSHADDRLYTATVEVTPARFAQDGSSAWLTSIAFLAGLQFL